MEIMNSIALSDKGIEARSRKKTSSTNNSSSNGNGATTNGDGIYIVSDSGDSHHLRGNNRSDRMAKRKIRVHRSRARKKTTPLNGLAFCLIAGCMFIMYLLICLILFHNMPDSGEGGEEAKGMRGLVKKTKEQVDRIRGRFQHMKTNLTPDEESFLNKQAGLSHKDDAIDAVANSSPKLAGNRSGKENSVQKSPVPVGIWPVSIRNEDGMFEDIKHPGFDDNNIHMLSVPNFWANDPVAIHENKLMSRERALSIGTCITPDPLTKSNTRGDACPLNERTIFVAIASYRDYQCRDTVHSAFVAAAHPERIRVGVVDQIVVGEDGSCDIPHTPCTEDPNQPLCLYKDQIDVYQMEAALAVGPVFARHIGHRLYRGEYYYTQSDAHVTFTKGWDDDIISQLEATGDEMAVLSTYLTDIVGSIDPNTGLSLRHTRPIMCNTEYEGGGGEAKHLRHLSQPEGPPSIRGMPQLQPYWAAGYSFSRGHFVATVPYDMYQPMIFQGEEMSIGLRGFTIGYDFFAPERSVCFHHYAKLNPERNKVPHYWEHANTFKGKGIGAMKRLLGIVNMNPEVDPSEWNHAEEAKYGLGGVRETAKFYELYGIDVMKKTTERHLCQFVENKMHNMFMEHLRKDGMGIDYSHIDFKWKDPRPNDTN